MNAANYDMPGMRKELITRLAATLKKSSKFYSDDYENIVRAVNRKTRAELIQSLANQCAIAGITQAETKRHCQV